MNPYCKEHTKASQNKAAARYYYTSIPVAKIQKTVTTPNAGKDEEPQERSFPAGGIQTGTATLEDTLLVAYKTKPTLTKGSSNSALGYLPERVESLEPHKHLRTDVYRIFIQNG